MKEENQVKAGIQGKGKKEKRRKRREEKREKKERARRTLSKEKRTLMKNYRKMRKGRRPSTGENGQRLIRFGNWYYVSFILMLWYFRSPTV